MSTTYEKLPIVLLVLICNLLSCQNHSDQNTKLIISKNEYTVLEDRNNSGILSQPESIYVDSTKLISFDDFQLIFTRFNKGFKMWYNPKLIIKNDTILIKDLSNENGSELSVRKSPDGKFFVLDNIIKGYVEDGSGNKILYENFECVIINVKKAKVEHSLQSECDGEWNEQNEWISSDGAVIFSE